jgi:hypothetical protein
VFSWKVSDSLRGKQMNRKVGKYMCLIVGYYEYATKRNIVLILVFITLKNYPGFFIIVNFSINLNISYTIKESKCQI